MAAGVTGLGVWQFVNDGGRPSATLTAVAPTGDAGVRARADAASGEDSDIHALQVIGAGHSVGDVPAAVYDDLVLRDVVANEREYLHHRVLRDADRVAVGHLGNGDALALQRPARCPGPHLGGAH